VGLGRRALSALGKIGIALSVIVVFLFGFLGTIYLSMHTAEVKVPDILGKDRYAGESALDDAGLNIRVARTRASVDKKPDTILWQYPEGGQVVKTGQTVAVEISRAPKEGESVASSSEGGQQETEQPTENRNANQTSAATNQNQNQNKPRNRNKNAGNANNANNKNANNSNNANGANANNRNMNANRNTNNSNRNANTPSTNRPGTNANKRPPATPTPAKPGANKGTPQ
jgi:hypothetical protein